VKLVRRQFLSLTAAAAALPGLPRLARAQAYPSRPVRLIIGLAAGGAVDILARLVAQWLSDGIGQQVIIENRPGAGGKIATEMVVNSPPDGYTLFLTTSAAAIQATLIDNLGYVFIRDIAPVAAVVRLPLILVINPSVPANTVPELIAYAKSNPGKMGMASAGNGSTPHMAGELFKMTAGVDMVHVPYRGTGPAITDLLGGQVQVLFSGVPEAIEHVRAGKLRALAVTTATRPENLPDIPTVGEFVPGYEAYGFFGVCAPISTPPEVVDKLNKAVNAALVAPNVKARLAEFGGVPMPMTPAEFRELVVAETEKWGKVVRTANIKP
jgi:tripartite-type tricarboxylate transporter receptor subunit TctC